MHKLLRDLVFAHAMASGQYCYRCGKELNRQTFSIEHKIDWLHSADPQRLFFDLENIAFSHIACNRNARANKIRKYQSAAEKRKADHARFNPLRRRSGVHHDPVARRKKYLRTGK